MRATVATQRATVIPRGAATPRGRPTTLTCTASSHPSSSTTRRQLLHTAGTLLAAAPLLDAAPGLAAPTSAFGFEVQQYGQTLSLSKFANQVLVMVNVASE